MTLTCGCRRFFGPVKFNGHSTRKIRQFCSSLATEPLVVVNPSSPSSSYRPNKGESEEKRYASVGIVEFLGTGPKIAASIKDKAAYFQVHEIDINGNRVQLTDLDTPPPTPPSDEEEKERKMKFLHFTVYKVEAHASEVVSIIHKELNKARLADPGGKITYAGRKDRKAQTTQRMCIPNYNGRAYPILSSLSARSRKMKFGNYENSSYPLRFGHMKGNHFKVLLNNVHLLEATDGTTTTFSAAAAATAIDSTMHSLKETGFVNYFGQQRFGDEDSAHLIGAAVLRMNWEEVIDLILTPRRYDRPHVTKIKAIWWDTRNISDMMNHTRRLNYSQMEVTQLLYGLSRHYQNGQGDLLKVYKTIPWDIRSIYVSAFTSFLWNTLASFRIRNFGLNVIPGDVVLIPPHSNNLEGSEKTFKILTEEDLEDHQYSIYDVLLPVLGAKVSRYANQRMQEFSEQLLTQHGLAPDCFAEYPLSTEIESGLYRHLLVKPQNVDHKVIPYDGIDFCYLKSFMPSDLDLLESSSRPDQSNETEVYNNSITRQITSQLAKNETAAIVEFSLPTSSYATMALREVMKKLNFKYYGS